MAYCRALPHSSQSQEQSCHDKVGNIQTPDLRRMRAPLTFAARGPGRCPRQLPGTLALRAGWCGCLTRVSWRLALDRGEPRLASGASVSSSGCLSRSQAPRRSGQSKAGARRTGCRPSHARQARSTRRPRPTLCAGTRLVRGATGRRRAAQGFARCARCGCPGGGTGALCNDACPDPRHRDQDWESAGLEVWDAPFEPSPIALPPLTPVERPPSAQSWMVWGAPGLLSRHRAEVALDCLCQPLTGSCPTPHTNLDLPTCPKPGSPNSRR